MGNYLVIKEPCKISIDACKGGFETLEEAFEFLKKYNDKNVHIVKEADYIEGNYNFLDRIYTVEDINAFKKSEAVKDFNFLELKDFLKFDFFEIEDTEEAEKIAKMWETATDFYDLLEFEKYTNDGMKGNYIISEKEKA